MYTCVFTGTIAAELVLRQVGSQSERPLGVERKVGRIDSLSRDMTTPLWDILRESIPVPDVGTTDAPPHHNGVELSTKELSAWGSRPK